jgi:hypothetical protein
MRAIGTSSEVKRRKERKTDKRKASNKKGRKQNARKRYGAEETYGGGPSFSSCHISSFLSVSEIQVVAGVGKQTSKKK